MFNKSNALRSARGNMAFVMVFTIVNLVLLFLNISASFPFSIFSPVLTGYWSYLSLMEGDTFGVILYLAIFVLVMGTFLLSWFFSQKKPKLMLIGFVLYLLDTAFMIWFLLFVGDNSWILDSLFHLWVLVSMGFSLFVSFTTPKPIVDPLNQDFGHNDERL
jgi:hypothetical protein